MQRQNVLSDENIEDWVTFYNLRKKLRCHPEILQSLNSPLVSFYNLFIVTMMKIKMGLRNVKL